MANAQLAIFNEAPALVHSHPLAWLQGGCNGVVVLDWAADLLGYMDGYGLLTTENQTGAKLQQALLQHVHIPEVRTLDLANAV